MGGGEGRDRRPHQAGHGDGDDGALAQHLPQAFRAPERGGDDDQEQCEERLRAGDAFFEDPEAVQQVRSDGQRHDQDCRRRHPGERHHDAAIERTVLTLGGHAVAIRCCCW
jgi:hypothetical protein